jgi:hypothetical protein
MSIAKWLGAVLMCGALLQGQTVCAQDLQQTGKSIGTVTTRGNLIVMTLDENVMGKANLFEFPFSEKNWDTFSAGVTGSIRFGAAAGGRGGISIGRFDRLQYAAHNLIDTVPAICVFFKPRMNGKRYVKELADRVVITWSLSEPAGKFRTSPGHRP